MTQLAYWPSHPEGNPRIVKPQQRIKDDQGRIIIFGQKPDPGIGLYAYVLAGPNPGPYEDAGDITYELSGDTVTGTKSVVPRSDEQVRMQRKKEVTDKFWAVVNGGMEVNMGGPDPVRIETTAQAMQEIDKLVELLGSQGGTQKAVTRSGARIQFDLATAQSLQTVLVARQAEAYNREYDLHEAIDDAVNLEAVLAVDINTGWPQ